MGCLATCTICHGSSLEYIFLVNFLFSFSRFDISSLRAGESTAAVLSALSFWANSLIGSSKLKNLSSYNKKRQKIAKFYNQKINNKKISKLNYSKYSVYHQYVILVNNRNKLIKLLKNNKIQYGFHYPYAIHQLNVFKKRFKNKRYKNAEILAKNSISLPIDPNLSKKELNYIVKTLNEF